MANEENLKKGEPYRFRAGEKQVEIARKGGVAAGEARRRKKAMRDTAKMMMDMTIPDSLTQLKTKLKAMGIDEEDITYQAAVMEGVKKLAIKRTTRAASFLRDTMGENPSLMLREKELEQRNAEFEYRKQMDAEQRSKEEETSTLADVIEEAYRKRMEGEKDAEQ